MCVHAFRSDRPVSALDISNTGLLALGLGREVQVLRHAFTNRMGTATERDKSLTYLKHSLSPPNTAISGGGSLVARTSALLSQMRVSSVRFRPLEDILGVGHSHGISTLIVPGAGEANFDSFEANPFMSVRQRREAEIQGLLHKLSHETIGLGTITIFTIYVY